MELNFSKYLSEFNEFDIITSKKDYFLVHALNSRKTVRVPKKLTNELCYFIGFFLGDGGLKNIDRTYFLTGKKEYKLIFGDYSKEFTISLGSIFTKLFGFNLKLREERIKKGEHYYYYNPTCKAVFLYLTKVIGFTHGKWDKVIPELIFLSSLENKKWFLRGYFDAEGSIYRKYNRKSFVISLHIKGRKLISQIDYLLAEVFGVETMLYHEKTYSKLFVTRKADVFKLINQELFTHSNKIFKMSQ